MSLIIATGIAKYYVPQRKCDKMCIKIRKSNILLSLFECVYKSFGEIDNNE